MAISRRRGIAAWTATLALFAGFMETLPPGTAAAASASSHHGLPIQKPGDAGWTPSGRPQNTTVAWKPPTGHATPVAKPDPHAKRVKELTGKRTANTTSYQMSDGSVQQELSAVPVHYKDSKGNWQNIDTTVKPLTHGSFTAGAEGNTFHTYFSSRADSLVQVESAGSTVQMGAVGATVAAPKLAGSGASYPGAWANTDLNYQVGTQGLKETILLAKAPTSPAKYAFTVTLGGGLTPKQNPNGSIDLFGTESANPVWSIPAPYMSDAKPDASSPYGKVYSTKVTQSMSFDAKTGTLHLTETPNAAWLADTHRQYPVAIDPTIMISPNNTNAANVMISADGPTSNYSTVWRLSVGTTATGAARALIKFPTPAIPAGTTITSADLQLYYDQNLTTGVNNVPMQALQANAAWSPTTATWNNASTIAGPVAGATQMTANALAVWDHFPVTSAVQNWINGQANNGFVIKATNETPLGQGGARFEGSIFAYNGEVVNYPKLLITYGIPGVAVNAPTVIHSTGAELSWPAYSNTTGNSANDVAEYQVHRSILQTFTPSASTEVSPVDPSQTSFVDSTAQPTPANNTDPYGNAYYYMVVVKTKSGELIPGPTQLVRLPEAGRTTLLIPAAAATTLSSAEPTTVVNTVSNAGTPEPWLEVGDNSGTYGVTRAVFDFGQLPQVPANSQILDAHLKLWQETTTTSTSGAVYELHALNTSFTGNQATWNTASTGTNWTTAGGDFNATADGTVSGLTNDPNRQNFDATSIVQGWINTAGTNHGLLVKQAAETSTSPQERTIFASPNTAEPALAPTLVVTYLDASTGSTYYAPSTPTQMAPGTTYTTPVTINNTTNTTWAAASEVLTYHWSLPDGTDVTGTGNQLQTALSSDLAPGATVTLNAQVTPPTVADGNQQEGYTLAWDMYNKTTGVYLSAGAPTGAASTSRAKAAATTAVTAGVSGGIGSLKQQTSVIPNGNNQLGLEQFYQYDTTATGDGSAAYVNAASGNLVWNDNLFSNPSRGFATFLRLSYNSLDTSDTTTGFGWSIQASTPTRLGQALEFHPNPHPTQVTLTDGTGAGHQFTWNSTSSTWTSPPGVHLFLQQLDTCGPQVADSRAWSMTRPDRTVFYYDCDGYPTAVVDNDGNEADFTYTQRGSNNKPTEFLSYITDPASRQTLTLSYYQKGDASYSYIDSTGALQTGSNLTDPAIIDHVKSITDVSGRTVDFFYTTQGLLARLVDGAGSTSGAPKTFNFTYDPTQGMKNVKLTAVQDPRGDTTNLAYFPNSSATKWWAQSVTDRNTHATTYAYTQPGTISGAATTMTVTDANTHAWTYQLDSAGRLIQSTNPLSQKMTLAWDADNNVTSLTEDNGAQTQWTYDPNTGYPLTQKDALAVKNNTAAVTYTYQTSLNGHIADVTDKVSAQGRHYHFTYDTNGNLLTVQDPMGTSTGSGYTTTYTYDNLGQLQTVVDANQHKTSYSNYDATGTPESTTDALLNTQTATVGPRGEILSITDALSHTSTQNYDTFLRPLDSKTPKDQASGVYISTPAPVYDANDNVTQKTAPNGAVSTAVYDAMDQATSSTLPQDTPTSPTRTTTYTYDNVGNQLTVTAPDGNVTGATAGSYTTTNTYDAINRVTASTDALGDKTSTGYDDVGNAINATDPIENGTVGNTTHITQTAYDWDHRPTSVTDAAGHSVSTAYDLDGLKVSTTDQNSNTTLLTLDARGKVTQQQVPHTSNAGTITYDTTQYTYDQVGNLLSTISPRGVASGITGSYTTRTSYDADNRKAAVFGADNPNDPVYNTAAETDYTYDAAGRTQQVTAPASGGQTVRPVTTYTYFDNGWNKSSTDPFGITTAYDYNPLGQQTSRTISSAGGSSSRTQGSAYYPDGKLQSQTDSGVPVGLQVEMVLNSDAQNASTTGTWASSSTGTGYQGYNYQTHAAGTGTDVFTWNLNVPEDGNYTVYVQYPSVTGAANNAAYTVHYTGGGTATTTVDQTDNAGTWVALGKWAFTSAGTGQSISLAQNAGGAVTANAVKIVRDNSGDTQPGPNNFTYTYDPNGDLTNEADNSPGAPYNAYIYTYDQVDRLTQLQEELSGTVKHTTGFTYNADGQPLTETHDAASAVYTYDARNLLSTVVNKETNTDTGKLTSYTYTPTSKYLTETKANNNVVTFGYNLDDSLASQVEKNTAGTVVASHNLSYDPNGNQTQDVSATQSADNSATTLNNTATDTYTPANQIASVTNTNSSPAQSYTYDLAGNITAQTVNGANTTNVYDRNRLLTATTAGVTADYNYDPFGRTDTVTAGGTTTARYTYDGFDHISTEQHLTAGGLTTTNYSYDALARTVAQTDNAGASGATTTTFDYLATSTSVADEQTSGSVSKVYQYAPTGERLDQIVHNSDGTETPTYYTYNPHTDVQAITDANGNTKSTYAYTAYGTDDTTGDTGVDKATGNGGTSSTTTEPYNTYRFNADRIDSATGNYNMGFRNYAPSLNRFLTSDMYDGAFADQNMTGDPYTGNRYAFGGGNPVSNVEFDGHEALEIAGGSGGEPTCDLHCQAGIAARAQYTGQTANYWNQAWNSSDPTSIPPPPGVVMPTLDKGTDWFTVAATAVVATVVAASLAAAWSECEGATVATATAACTGAVIAAGDAVGCALSVCPRPGNEGQGTDPSDGSDGASSGIGSLCHSFAGDTRVKMADGTTKPISEVKVGDEIENAQPGGATEHHRVDKLHRTLTDKDFTDLTVSTLTGPKTITGTQNHPYYDLTTGKFTNASQLKPGDRLQSDGPADIAVISVHNYTSSMVTYDLTIDDLHTYYIEAGSSPVLVHNSDCGIDVQRSVMARAYYLNQSTRVDPKGSNVAVALVTNVRTGESQTWVSTEGSGLPAEWSGSANPLAGTGERFIPGGGDAEQAIVNALGSDWQIQVIASRQRICQACYSALNGLGYLVPSNLVGVGDENSPTDATPYRVMVNGG